MQQLGGFTSLFLLHRGVRDAGNALQERFECIGGRFAAGRRRRRHARVWRGPGRIILFFDHVGEDESIPVARNGTNEARFPRVVAKRAANRPDSLTERAVGHDHIGPDAIEDIAAVHGFVSALDQQHEEIEVARNERQLAPGADEKPSLRRHNEIAEAVAGHNVR